MIYYVCPAIKDNMNESKTGMGLDLDSFWYLLLLLNIINVREGIIK